MFDAIEGDLLWLSVTLIVACRKWSELNDIYIMYMGTYKDVNKVHTTYF